MSKCSDRELHNNGTLHFLQYSIKLFQMWAKKQNKLTLAQILHTANNLTGKSFLMGMNEMDWSFSSIPVPELKSYRSAPTNIYCIITQILCSGESI